MTKNLAADEFLADPGRVLVVGSVRRFSKAIANRMLDALVPASCFWVLVES
jgi:hypothetical protein